MCYYTCVKAHKNAVFGEHCNLRIQSKTNCIRKHINDMNAPCGLMEKNSA